MQLLWFHSIQIGSWTIINRNFFLAVIFFFNPFIMDWKWILSVEKSKAGINSSMISMRFCQIWSIQECWNLPVKVLPFVLQNNSLNHQHMNFMMYIALFPFLHQKWILFNRKFIKTVFSSETEMIGSFIMTVQTTTLKLNRKMETRDMGKARSIVPTRLSKWDFSQMATESL